MSAVIRASYCLNKYSICVFNVAETFDQSPTNNSSIPLKMGGKWYMQNKKKPVYIRDI